MLKGQWKVNYIPDEYNYRDILRSLLEINDWKKNIDPKVRFIKILFNKKFKTNCFFLKRSNNHFHSPTLYLKLKNDDLKNIKKNKSCHFEDIHLKNKTKNKNILLCFPMTIADKRWKTVHLIASSIFLGSSLSRNKHNVEIKKLVLPSTDVDRKMLHFDVLGFTLFEDLYHEMKDLLCSLKSLATNGQPLFAAGGPMVTLNPLQTAYHMTELNLLVRGEAEFVFPKILHALGKNNINQLLDNQGFFFQIPGLIIISNLDLVNRPERFGEYHFNLDFIKKDQLKNGLEINFSRGCQRKCIFCCKVQGSKLRQLPVKKIDELLRKFSSRLDDFNVKSDFSRSININDDDILQDMKYTKAVFKQIKKNNFKIWGIQCSINSFFNHSQTIQQEILKIINDRELYIENSPLLWIGTDFFLKKRGKRMGKGIVERDQIIQLIERFETEKIRNFHYWISSDYDSTWEEFIEEFIFIYGLKKKYKMFSILAHAPFPKPYFATNLFKFLIQSPDLKNQIKYRQILRSNHEIFHFPLVQHVETKYKNLNQLLKNEKIDNRDGFIDYLNRNDYLNAFITVYNFLKQERIYQESSYLKSVSDRLKKLEKRIEDIISKLI